MVKPRHFCHFCEKNNDHFDDLLVVIFLILNHEVYEEVLNTQFLFDWDLGPVGGKQSFES